jgi:ankyrin repeat protein
LLKKGADANTANVDGLTALLMAAGKGLIKVVNGLIVAGEHCISKFHQARCHVKQDLIKHNQNQSA